MTDKNINIISRFLKSSLMLGLIFIVMYPAQDFIVFSTDNIHLTKIVLFSNLNANNSFC